MNINKTALVEDGLDPLTSELWAPHTSAAQLCLLEKSSYSQAFSK